MALSPDTTRTAYDRDAPTTSAVSPAEDMRTMALHSISWGAVFAGAVIALVARSSSTWSGSGSVSRPSTRRATAPRPLGHSRPARGSGS